MKVAHRAGIALIELPPLPGEVPQACASVGEIAALAGLTEQGCFEVRVVVAEILNNIIEHARPGTCPQEIRIRCQKTDRAFAFSIVDRGPPIPQLPDGQVPHPQSRRGRGWSIIVNWVDHWDYAVQEGENRLALEKNLP